MIMIIMVVIAVQVHVVLVARPLLQFPVLGEGEAREPGDVPRGVARCHEAPHRVGVLDPADAYILLGIKLIIIIHIYIYIYTSNNYQQL